MKFYELIPTLDKARHLFKSLSYRIYSSCITTSIATFVTGNTKLALAIGTTDFIIKIFTYYIHERIWFHIPFGLQRPRKIHTDIDWNPTSDSYVQVAFIQHESGDIRKRVKILSNMFDDWVAVLSLYNRKTKNRYSDIIIASSLQQIEEKLKIKIHE